MNEHAHHGRFSEWATWFIRLLIPAILLGGWETYQELQHLTVQVALVSEEMQEHSRELEAIWRRLGLPQKHPPDGDPSIP